MNRPTALFRTSSGGVTVGDAPRVIAALSDLAWDGPLAGDIIEVRFDRLTDTSDWLNRCAAWQSRGKPVLLTARLATEGGHWPADDQKRLQLYRTALTRLAAVDVELSSAICADVCAEARLLGKAAVVSYHNFKTTPFLTDLTAIIQRAQGLGAVVKVSTMLHSEADVKTLEALLAQTWERPLCVIGMGDQWSSTRISFARQGSCFTYGYLDKPTAPGQISAAELSTRLAAP